MKNYSTSRVARSSVLIPITIHSAFLYCMQPPHHRHIGRKLGFLVGFVKYIRILQLCYDERKEKRTRMKIQYQQQNNRISPNKGKKDLQCSTKVPNHITTTYHAPMHHIHQHQHYLQYFYYKGFFQFTAQLHIIKCAYEECVLCIHVVQLQLTQNQEHQRRTQIIQHNTLIYLCQDRQ